MRSRSRAGSLPVSCPAQRRPARTKSRQAAKQALSDAGGSSHSPQGDVRGLALAPVCAVEGVRRHRRRQAKAERRRGGRSPSPPGKAQVGPGAHSGGVWPSAGLRCRRRTRRRRRRQIRAERRSEGTSHAGRALPLPIRRSPSQEGRSLVWTPAQSQLILRTGMQRPSDVSTCHASQSPNRSAHSCLQETRPSPPARIKAILL